jgi:hypothetical protein
MDISTDAIIERHWNTLSHCQWQWEFLRRSDQFKEDSRIYLETMGKNKLFVAIWDLPHPGDDCIVQYAYLQDFRTLLTRILGSWLECGKPSQKAESDLLRLAKALNLDGEFYDAPHSLVNQISPHGLETNQGDYKSWSRYIEASIILPNPLKLSFRSF